MSEDSKRQYKVIHEKIVLEVDPEEQSLSGFCDFVISPLRGDLNRVGLNASPQINVLEVTVNDNKAEWTHYKSSESKKRGKRKREPSPSSEIKNVRNLRNFEMYQDELMDVADFGELTIEIPRSLRFSFVQLADGPKDREDGGKEKIATLFSPFMIRVAYEIVRPTTGITFVDQPKTIDQQRSPKSFCVYTLYGQPSAWFPCADASMCDSPCSERMTFDIQLTVPSNYVAVASGKQSVPVSIGEQKVYSFTLDVPVSPNAIGFAVAQFESVTESGISSPSIVHFYVNQGKEEEQKFQQEQLLHTTKCSQQIFNVIQDYLGVSYPYETYYHAFVEGCGTDFFPFAGLAICDASILCDVSVIDQTYHSWQALAYAVAFSWINSALLIDSVSDTWIISGLSFYLASLYVEKAFGRNESEWQRLTSHYSVCELDDTQSLTSQSDPKSDGPVEGGSEDGGGGGSSSIFGSSQSQSSNTSNEDDDLSSVCSTGSVGASGGKLSSLDGSRPLCWNGYLHQPEARTLQNKKAAVVMKMLEQAVGRDNFRNLCRRILLDFVDSKDVASLQPNQPRKSLSTKGFFKLAKEMCNDPLVDLKNFCEQWVMCDGYPILRCEFNFNRKNTRTEVTVYQEQQKQRNVGLKFSGELQIVIHEVGRTNLRTQRVDDAKHPFNYPCSSRLKRNRRRKHVQEDKLKLSEILSRDMDTPVHYIRADPLLLWFRPAIVEQTEVMWVHQLRKDKDVISQYEAVSGIRRLIPTNKATYRLSSNALQENLRDQKWFHRIRAFAALALAESNRLSQKAIPQLIKIFKEYYYERNILKHNDFSKFPDYFLKKEIPCALSLILGFDRLTPPQIIAFILPLLQNNDNSKNKYSDSFYLAALLRCLGNIRLSKTESVDPLWAELSRYLDYDQVIPSYHNLITQAVLESLCKLEVTQQMKNRVNYHEFLKDEHFFGVRLTAFKCLAYLSPSKPELVFDMLKVMNQQRYLGEKHAMAKAWADIFSRFSLGFGAQSSRVSDDLDGIVSGGGSSVSTLTSDGVFVSWSEYVCGSMPSSLSLPLPPTALSLEKFRVNNATNAKFMNELWLLLCSTIDPVMRWSIYRLYRAIWGRGTPPCASPEQKDTGIRVWNNYPISKSRQRQTVRTLSGVEDEVSRNTKRRYRAKEELVRRRAQRAWEPHVIETANKIRIKRSEGKLKATKSDLYGASEE